MSVELRYCEGLGNNLFQYAFARIIAEELGRELVCVSGAASGLERYAAAFADAPQHIAGRAIAFPQLRYTRRDRPGWDEHGLDLGYLLRAGADRRIVLQGYFQRSEYYVPHRAKIRRWFAPSRVERRIPDIHPDDVIVHVRRGDYFATGSVVGVEYYERVLDRLRPRRVFVTGVGIDERTRAALARFDPRWLDLDPLSAVWTIADFPRIVAANSTFSWWAAFLSNASEVYFPRPVSGLWSRETTRIALDVDDPSYHYVDGVEVEEWRPYTPQWRALDVCRPTSAGPDGTVSVTAAGGRQSQIAIAEGLAPLCGWLAHRSSPFGYADVAHLIDEVPGPMLVKLLEDLIRADALLVSELN